MMQNEPQKEGKIFGSPKWWKEDHTSAFERAKAAIRRDWEQTKHDLTGGRKGVDIDQDVGDTVKQAAGKGPGDVKTTGHQFDQYEDSIRYGYGAASHYSDHKDWDDSLEAKMKTEWNDLKSGRTWDDVKYGVKYGFNSGRRSIH